MAVESTTLIAGIMSNYIEYNNRIAFHLWDSYDVILAEFDNEKEFEDLTPKPSLTPKLEICINYAKFELLY